MCRVLSDAGFSATATGDGAGALAHVASRPTDLLLLDLKLASRDDCRLITELRRGHDPPPLVGMGSAGSIESFSAAVREGVAGFVARPFHMGELIETCRRAIEAHELRPRRERPPSDRRKDTRRNLQVAVHLLSSSGLPIALGEMIDLSATGAQLILVAPFEAGDRVRVSLDPAQTGRILELRGVVRWQSRLPTGFSHGVEFEDLSPEARAQLERLRPSSRNP